MRFGKRTAILALRKKDDRDIYAYEYECLRCASFFGIDGKAPPDPKDTFHPIYNLTQVDRALCQDGPSLNDLENSFAIVNRSVDQLGDSKCDFKATLDTADKNKLYAVTIYVHFPEEEKRAPTDKDRQQFKELMKVDDSMFKDKPILLMTQAIKRWKFSDDGTGKPNEWEGLMEQIEPPHAVYPLLFIAILAFMAFVIGTYLSGRHIAREYGFLPPLKDQGEEYRKELEQEEEEAQRQEEAAGMSPHGQ